MQYHSLLFEDAIKDYDDALKYDPGNAETFYNRGNVYLHQESFDRAHNDFDRAINLDDSNSKFYHAKGLVF